MVGYVQSISVLKSPSPVLSRDVPRKLPVELYIQHWVDWTRVLYMYVTYIWIGITIDIIIKNITDIIVIVIIRNESGSIIAEEYITLV